jgi:hypothetical protein
VGKLTPKQKEIIMNNLKITEAFKRNLDDDFTCGLSLDTLERKHGFVSEDFNDLLNNRDALITYVKAMLRMNEGLCECEGSDRIGYLARINTYRAFLKNNEGKSE